MFDNFKTDDIRSFGKFLSNKFLDNTAEIFNEFLNICGKLGKD